MRATVPLLVVTAVLCGGCDPVHTSHTYVTFRPPEAGTRDSVVATVDGGDAGVAASIVAAAARELGFEPYTPAETGGRDRDPEYALSFTASYEAYPGKGLYHTLYIHTGYRPDDRRFEVAVSEFVASTEWERGR